MRTLAFDGRTGAAGDMILGALVDAGADPNVLAPVEKALGVTYRIRSRTERGIAATTVDVILEEDDGTEDNSCGSGHGRESDHKHGHDCEIEHEHRHDHSHEHAEGGGPNRSYAECLEIVGDMDLPPGIEADAEAIFKILGEAEALVHGTDLGSVHFHEVGADDAIADIVGAALLIDDLGVGEILTTPVAAGGGEVSMSHGIYPVPTPAVAEIAADASWTLQGGPGDTELLTPTGAAILAWFAEGVDSLPPFSLETVGYGAGSKSLADRPNVLRATVGHTDGGLTGEEIRVLETNVDDVTPEIIGGLSEQLADAGARDVTVVPTTMKKSRPGHLLKVIVRPEDAAAVARKLASETGTLGIREGPARHRWIADREIETVTVQIDGKDHEIDVKVAVDDAGEVYDVSAEFDDAATVAEAVGVPTREVMRRAEAAYRDRRG